MALKDPRLVLNKYMAGYYPACFNSSAEYAQWRALMRTSQEHMAVGFCVDCTPEYKMEMMSEGRCAHPETRFVLRSTKTFGTELIGVSSKSIYWARIVQDSAVLREDDGENK